MLDEKGENLENGEISWVDWCSAFWVFLDKQRCISQHVTNGTEADLVALAQDDPRRLNIFPAVNEGRKITQF